MSALSTKALSTLAAIVAEAEFGDCRRTVAEFGDYSRQCGQGLNVVYGDFYSPMKAENTQLQETEWIEDRQTY